MDVELFQKAPFGTQHPSGDALAVEEGFFAKHGRDMYIYIQDHYPDWPYHGGRRPGDLDGRWSFLDVVERHPDSSLVWALLAEASMRARTQQGDVTAYAFARTGYHRGLDALRRAGWRGKGPIPWEHEPNQGFLRVLWALACAARRIGEQAEYERCVVFLLEASESGYVALATSRPLVL